MPGKISCPKIGWQTTDILRKNIVFSSFPAHANKPYDRGKDYVDFAPDRVAMQDATAQMALLQFMTAGRTTVAVPSTVHCDHLIQAKIGAKKDLTTGTLKRTVKYMISWLPFPINMVSVSGNPVPVSFTR